MKVLLKHSFHLNSSSWLCPISADPRKPPPQPLDRWLEGNAASAVMARGSPTRPPTQFASINAAAARVRPGRATDSPRETPPVGHLTCYGSTFLSHSITIPRTHTSGDVTHRSAHRCTQWCIIIMKSGMCRAPRPHLISVWEETALICWKHLMSW